MSTDLTARVLAIIAECQHLPPDAVTLDSSFDELQIDSLGAVAIVAEVETAFDIEVPNERVLAIRSVRDIVAAVASLVGAGASGLADVAAPSSMPLPSPSTTSELRPTVS